MYQECFLGPTTVSSVGTESKTSTQVWQNDGYISEAYQNMKKNFSPYACARSDPEPPSRELACH